MNISEFITKYSLSKRDAKLAKMLYNDTQIFSEDEWKAKLKPDFHFVDIAVKKTVEKAVDESGKDDKEKDKNDFKTKK